MSSGLFNIDVVKLDQIIITNAAIDNKAQLSSLEKGKHEFKLVYGFIPGYNILDKKFRIIFTCEIKTLNEIAEEIDVKANFDIAFFFSVDNLDDLIKLNDEEHVVDIDLITSLANVTYSTSRGIIYTRCQGTIIKNLILPILSTDKLLELLQPESVEKTIKQRT